MRVSAYQYTDIAITDATTMQLSRLRMGAQPSSRRGRDAGLPRLELHVVPIYSTSQVAQRAPSVPNHVSEFRVGAGAYVSCT